MLKKNLSICIAGKNDISVFALDLVMELFSEAEILCLCNKNDEGYDTWQPSLRKYASFKEIKVVNLEDVYEIEDLIFISLEFDRIIKPELFASKNLFNIHFSKLPAYKGMYTSALPLLHNEKESGVTLHKIDRGIDTGEQIDQIIFNIEQVQSSRDLYFLYLEHSKALLKRNINNLVFGPVNSYPQSAEESSYYSRNYIDYSNLQIDLNKTAQEIENQIKAFNFPEYQIPIVKGFKISNCKILKNRSLKKPGTILKDDFHELEIASIDYDVCLKKDMFSLLMQRCKVDDVKEIQKILDEIKNINLRNEKGWTPLIVASYFGSLKMIEILLNVGADINYTNYKGTTPLMYAMTHFEETGQDKSFNLLMEKGADINKIDIYGMDLRAYAKERNVQNLV